MQVREGNVVVLDDKLFEVIKYNYSQGHGRQLGVVQVSMRTRECLQSMGCKYYYIVNSSGLDWS